MLFADVKMPVAMEIVIAVEMRVRVGVEPARICQPSADATKQDQQAPADELAAALEPDGNLPPEKEDGRGANAENERMSDGKTNGQPERAAVSRGSQRRGQRQRGNRHQVIGPQAMEKSEREHRSGQHGGDYSWTSGFRLRASGLAQSLKPGA